MVTVDTTYRDERARLAREAGRTLGPLVERIRRDIEGRLRGGQEPAVDVDHWSGPLASALSDVGMATVSDIGLRVTEALGGIVEERARRVWSPEGTANYIATVADAMARGELGKVASYLLGQSPERRRFTLGRVAEFLESTGVDMVDVAANFAAFDAGERAGAQKKRWQVNSGNPRSSHAAVNGQERAFGEEFSNGMPYPRGPSPDGAAGVANCECSLVIIKEDA